MHAYDIVYLVKAAYEKGGTDRASLIKSLHDLETFDGVSGSFHFDEYGDVDKDSLMLVVKNGKFQRYSD